MPKFDFFETSVNNKKEKELEKRKNISLWVEKYRPMDLSNFVGNDHIKNKVNGYIKNNDIPHILLHGPAGTGKTSISKILVNNIDCDYKYVNASDENSVDDVRMKIKNFASSAGFKDLKIVILDECLDENTLVHILRNGEEHIVKIKELNEETDLVKSYNLKKNEIQYRPFDLHNIGESEVYELELENGEKVICTDTHKWYVEDSNNNRILVKTKDIIYGKYDHILSV